jgi:hypothetical protein
MNDRRDEPKTGTCPDCGSPLRIPDADPEGRPECTRPPFGCGYVGAATRTPAPPKWGPREDAHLAAVEKWLADEWRDDTEIEAMLDTSGKEYEDAAGRKMTGYELAARAFGACGLAYTKRRAILKAELKTRREQDKGRHVQRTGDKVEAMAPTKARAAKVMPEAATPTAQLESEIIRILNRDLTHDKARPTASELYQEHIINGRTMAGLARANEKWAVRTMKKRKADMEAHLTETLHMPVDLDAFRTTRRKSGRIVYTDPGVIERTHSDETDRDED